MAEPAEMMFETLLEGAELVVVGEHGHHAAEPRKDEDVPPWVARTLARLELVRLWPTQLATTLLEAVLCIYCAWAGVQAARAAGLAASTACAARASLFWLVTLLAVFFDWLSMGWQFNRLHVNHLPSIFDTSRRGVLVAAHKTFGEFLPTAALGAAAMSAPVAIWLRHGIADFAGALVGLFFLAVNHSMLNLISMVFWGFVTEGDAQRYTHALLNGDMTYDEAVRRLRSLNVSRRRLARGFIQSTALFWAFGVLQQAIVVYDMELRPWGGWPLAIVYITSIMSHVLFMSPWIGANDFVAHLTRGVMESTALQWTPTERTNFSVHLKHTRVVFEIFGFRMSHSFATALAVVYLGWWLYVVEFRLEHGTGGFPFDQMCVPANWTTGGEEEGGGHGHEARGWRVAL